MNQYQELKKLLSRTPVLVADSATSEVDLISEGEAISRMASAPAFHSRVMLHAASALEGFADLLEVGREDRSYDRNAVAHIVGVPPSTIFLWMQEGILPPSIREGGAGRGKGPLWSWRDAFVAGLCGSLRRQGVRQELLHSVQRLFADQKKRTAERAATR